MDASASATVPQFGPAAFGTATENDVLRRRIGEEIRRAGRISFRRFMELALYDPEEGYYATRDAIGTRGDYLTSPELHPLFGGLLARQIAEFWQLLDRPEPFVVVEAGAGSGALARAILASFSGSPVSDSLRYTIVEPRAHSASVQRSTLGALASHVHWCDSFEGTDADAGCILSNELIDSFPVHRVRLDEGRLREIFVGEEGGRFIEVIDEPSTPALLDHFERLGVLPGEGCEAEVNLEAPVWLHSVAARLIRGFLLTLDYGYPARTLYAQWRKHGTLLCFYRHTSTTDPFVHIGYQDITSHVDFSALALAGRDVGLEPLGFTSQQRLLSALGIGEALAGGPTAASSLEEYLARRRAVEALLDPQGLGRIRALVQGKTVGKPALSGFRIADEEPLA